MTSRGLWVPLGVAVLAGVALLSALSTTSPQGKAASNQPANTAQIVVETPMNAPSWATLERELLDRQTPACVEFYKKYYDDGGHVQCVLRWGADDGPDDAFENFAGW